MLFNEDVAFAPPVDHVVEKKIVRVPSFAQGAYTRLGARVRGEVSGVKRFHWGSYWHTRDGYGQSAVIMAEELHKRGYEMELRDTGNEYQTLDCAESRLIQKLRKKRVSDPDFEFAFCMAPDMGMLDLTSPFLVFYSMWEATELPKTWIPFIREADTIITPSEWVASVFHAAVKNLSIPVVVVNVPLRSEVYKFREKAFLKRMYRTLSKRRPKPFRFLFVSTPVKRKGIDVLIEAFQQAFPVEALDNVALHLHMRTGPLNRHVFPEQDKVAARVEDDYRITYNLKPIPLRKLLKVYDKHDCLVHTSRSEGFGLTPCQAMACGLPVICTNATGCTEYVMSPEPYAFPINISGWESCDHAFYKEGEWSTPDVGHAAHQMRYVYEHREEAMDRANKGSRWVLKNFGREATVAKLERALEWSKAVHNLKMRSLKNSAGEDNSHQVPSQVVRVTL